MPRRRLPTQTDLTRAVKAVVAAGLCVVRVKVSEAGIEIVTADTAERPRERQQNDFDA